MQNIPIIFHRTSLFCRKDVLLIKSGVYPGLTRFLFLSTDTPSSDNDTLFLKHNCKHIFVEPWM